MLYEVLVDVSEMEPPDPLVLTLQAAEELKPGQYVRMLHRRDPCMLYDNLDEHQFRYYQRKGTATAVEVFIWKENDVLAAEHVNAVTGITL